MRMKSLALAVVAVVGIGLLGRGTSRAEAGYPWGFSANVGGATVHVGHRYGYKPLHGPYSRLGYPSYHRWPSNSYRYPHGYRSHCDYNYRSYRGGGHHDYRGRYRAHGHDRHRSYR